MDSHCKACHADITNHQVGFYSLCSICGSANFISDKSAEEDNNDYFNHPIDSTVVPLRKLFFSVFNAINKRIYHNENAAFKALLSKIDNALLQSGTCLEIGFGGGDELIQRLNSGANIYGSDLSQKIVDDFRGNYPQYADRVTCENAIDLGRRFDAIYSNAMFEHLDEPDAFLEKIAGHLPENGKLIMRIPLITHAPATDNPPDINFWPPCHRVLYTRAGLDSILERHGLTITESAQLNYYGYKVMNIMLERGYQDILSVRNPYYALSETTGGSIAYVTLLFKSLFKNVICSDFALIAQKVAC